MTDITTVASNINDAIQDPVPQISPPPNNTVELLLGLNGDRTAVVREMTGADEEFLAALEIKNSFSYAEYISALLKRTVVSIGDAEVKKFPDMVDSLIVGDRDILFIAVIKATYGNTRTFKTRCGSCGELSDVGVNLDEEFEIQGTSEDAEKKIIVSLKDGNEITLNLPTGGDSKYVTKKGKTTAEQNTLMIARCANISNMNADQKEHWARNLNLSDRNKLVAALLDIKLGPKVGEVNDPCPYCGEMINITLDWVSLLFG